MSSRVAKGLPFVGWKYSIYKEFKFDILIKLVMTLILFIYANLKNKDNKKKTNNHVPHKGHHW